MVELSVAGHPLAGDPKIGKSLRRLPFKNYRKCKRDGNCLYYCITLLIFPLFKKAEFKTRFLSFVDSFQRTGFSSVVYESYMESIEDIVANKSIEDLVQDDLNVFVGYLKLTVSAHLRINEEEYRDFLGCNVETYARKKVEAMGQRAGHIEIMALSRSLCLEISVYDVSSGEINEMKFGEGHPINILHTPDHFEPIYR